MINKSGVTKLSISLIFILALLLMIASSLANTGDVSNAESATLQTKNIYSTSSVDNMKVVSETKNNLNVTWFPVFVGLTDKEYNITIMNLGNKERSVSIDAFFKALTAGVDIVVPGSIQLSYFTTLTKIVDDYTESCVAKQIVLSKGESNETTRSINECTAINNPKTITYQGWKAYPVNEVRDKLKKEITLQKTNENGKITLPPNSRLDLNLKFKTKVKAREDGTFGNDGDFGLLLDSISYHPTFNVSFRKRYLVDITANDAINTNFTHNISLVITGNSTEIGSRTIIRANNTVLACDNIHVIFNDTVEIDREIEACNTSDMKIYFRNRVNMTRNQMLPGNYSIYYHPFDAQNNPQPPRDWSSIWLTGSTNFDDGQNDTLYEFDNATRGNSTWRNVFGNGYVELKGEGDPNDGCLVGRDITNTTEASISMEFLLQRVNAYTDDAGNKAFGLNDRPCHVSPNTAATGFFLKDSPEGLDHNLSTRIASSGALTSSSLQMGRPDQGTWQLMQIKRTVTSSILNETEFFVTSNSSMTVHEVISSKAPPVEKLIRPLFRSERFTGPAIFNLDEIRIIQLVTILPSYIITQENITFTWAIQLNNPPNGTTNTSRSHTFDSNASYTAGLVNATLYNNLSGSWSANQTVNVSGTDNVRTTFNISNIAPGGYTWNVQWCGTDNVCNQSNSNFTFKVIHSTATLPVKACTAENKKNAANTYNESCEGTYPAVCGSNTTNDFLSCNDGNLETQTYRLSKFTGLHIQAYNSSINNCESVANVTLCYRWWAGSSSNNCLVAVDADGNASYTTINSTCPNTVNETCPEASPTPLIVCTDVTSSENWTCNSFFGINGTKAVARTELSSSSTGPSQMLRTDALFFNVTYVKI